MPARRFGQLLIFVAGCLLFVNFWIFSSSANEKLAAETPAGDALEFESPPPENQGSYTKFSHAEPQHARLPCLLCHKREDNSPTPRMTGHLPCAGCHQQQFEAGNQHPICQICHTATSVKPFPPLKSFNALFDHAKHQRQTTCATCHKPARRGVAFSIPSRLGAHATCYQCHTPQAQAGERSLGSCGTCHQPGRVSRTSEFVKAYTVGFSHAAHGQTRNLNCAACHTVRAGMPRGRQVTAPLAAMHFAPARAQSCATCHNTKRAFGEDFSDCRRCHRGGSFRF